MALLVWFTTGIALWHFTVFLPDRFWQGIVGAFIGSTLGALVTGAIGQEAAGRSIGDTDISTVLWALPGVVIGLAIVYAIGSRSEQPA
jgi:ABC-type Fe3+ transport system permease subunit